MMAPGLTETQKSAPSHIDTPVTNEAMSTNILLEDEIAGDQYGNYYPMNLENLRLESNFGPMLPGQMGYLQPSSMNTPIGILQQSFKCDGYLLARTDCILPSG
jgi:phytanoyl-CoA hydroxylase